MPAAFKRPRFNTTIIIRNPSKAPVEILDKYGRVVSKEPNPAGYETKVYASKRDNAVYTTLSEEGLLHVSKTLFVIYNTSFEIDIDCEVIHNGKLYIAVGPPVERSVGEMEDSRFKYLLIYTELRS